MQDRLLKLCFRARGSMKQARVLLIAILLVAFVTGFTQVMLRYE